MRVFICEHGVQLIPCKTCRIVTVRPVVELQFDDYGQPMRILGKGWTLIPPKRRIIFAHFNS